MSLTLYAHPFSSYSQKVLVALWENETPFEYRNMEDPGVAADLAALWPVRKFPVLTDDGRIIPESSLIIEHLDRRHPGPTRFIPDEAEEAGEVRLLDRVFDQHVMKAAQPVVNEAIRAVSDRMPEARAATSAALETIYTWLDARLSGRRWAVGQAFSMADCAAAPSLFYADWIHPIPESLRVLRSYRSRLLDRPSFARAIEEGRPYRGYFPLGAPDRD
ncbi:MAG: glutathione S-transferase family protein [Brevundimonas sp.]